MAEYSPIYFWQSAATSSSFLDLAISLNAINDKEIVVNRCCPSTISISFLLVISKIKFPRNRSFCLFSDASSRSSKNSCR